MRVRPQQIDGISEWPRSVPWMQSRALVAPDATNGRRSSSLTGDFNHIENRKLVLPEWSSLALGLVFYREKTTLKKTSTSCRTWFLCNLAYSIGLKYPFKNIAQGAFPRRVIPSSNNIVSRHAKPLTPSSDGFRMTHTGNQKFLSVISMNFTTVYC